MQNEWGTPMHGVVNRGLQLFLIEEYGEDFWRELAASSDQDRGFEALLIYDDTVARWLMSAAVRRLNCIRSKDCMARIGGDEFLLFFVRIADPVFLRRIAAHLEKPARFDQHVCCISASAGTSISIDCPIPIPMSFYQMPIGHSMPVKKPVAGIIGSPRITKARFQNIDSWIGRLTYSEKGDPCGPPSHLLSAHHPRQPEDQRREGEEQNQAHQLDHHELHHAQVDVLEIPIWDHAFQEIGG